MKDDAVGEIIIINNAQAQIPFDITDGRVTILPQATNLYVNPSWNWGVKLAKFDYIAIVNDDIVPIGRRISQILEKGWLKDKKVGLLGIDIWCKRRVDDISLLDTSDSKERFYLCELPICDGIGDWGAFIMGRRDSFYEIPEQLKIVWGDHYMIRKNRMDGKKCYMVKDLPCFHIHSCSCGSKEFEAVCAADHALWHREIKKQFEVLTMYKFSIIIPTLLIREDILNKLLDVLVKHECIDEVIIINNNLAKDFSHSSSKVIVHKPKENLFVNMSWNVGVEMAKNEYIGLLNDDILIGEDFFDLIFRLPLLNDPGIGFVGVNHTMDFGIAEDDLSLPTHEGRMYWQTVNPKALEYWGICMLGRKDHYYPIPEELKILCGDNYLVYKNKLAGRVSVAVGSLPIKHVQSMSCRTRACKEVNLKDLCLWGQKKHEFLGIDENTEI